MMGEPLVGIVGCQRTDKSAVLTFGVATGVSNAPRLTELASTLTSDMARFLRRRVGASTKHSCKISLALMAAVCPLKQLPLSK